MTQSTYTKTYTSFSGADIVATFNGKMIGELQAITYSVTREKAPIYTMGSANPRSFSRGKRGIAGSLVFTVFDRDALHGLKSGATIHRHKLAGDNFIPVHQLTGGTDAVGDWNSGNTPVTYSDEIPPFDIVINFLNEYGQSASMEIRGVEILNEGSGMSIDDITTEKACTFIAREIVPMGANSQTGDIDRT
jgi:hypothetical protein